jgi:sec-independent protein translocase protein TatA
MPSLLAFLGSVGMPELLIIGVIVLLLFGNRLPSVMRSLGRGVVEFKKGVSGDDDDHDDDRDHDRDHKSDKERDDRERRDDKDQKEHKS